MPVVTNPFLFVYIFFQPKKTSKIPAKINVFEAGNITVYSIQTNVSFPTTPTKRYQRFPGLLNPSSQDMIYIVNGKPYISMYNATMNAKYIPEGSRATFLRKGMNKTNRR